MQDDTKNPQDQGDTHIRRLSAVDGASDALACDKVSVSDLAIHLTKRKNSSTVSKLVTTPANIAPRIPVLDRISDAVCIADADLQIVECNKVLRDWYGGNAALAGQSCRSLFGHVFEQIDRELLQPLATGSQPAPMEAYIRIRKNKGIWAEVSAFPWTLEDNETQGVIIIIRDITRLKTAENEAIHKANDLGLVNTVARSLGRSLAMTETLVSIKTAMSTSDLLVGGRLLIYDPAIELLWQGVAWGVAEGIAFQPVPVSEFYAEYIVSRPAVVHGQDHQNVTSTGHALKDYASWCVPIVSDNDLQGMMELFSSSHSEFDPGRRGFYRLLGQQIGTAMQNARLYEEVRAGRERLKALSANLVQAVESERRNLAQDLHDEVGQALMALQLAIGLSSRDMGTEHKAQIRDQQAMVFELTTRIRELITDMRPGVLEDEGLIGGIQWHINRLPKLSDLSVSFTSSGMDDRRFIPEVETVFFRIAQEALTNVVRHSDASSAELSIDFDGDILRLTIIDDGRGFDVYSKLAHSGHYGLVGMFERAEAINGTLNIDSSPAGGTKLTLSVGAQAIHQG